MAERIQGIFRFIDPPGDAALQSCLTALNACTFPWDRCKPELGAESGGLVNVIWDASMALFSGVYAGGNKNQISLGGREPSVDYGATFLHEAGHMVDDTTLRDEQKKAIVDKFHADNNGAYPHGEHGTSHTHFYSAPGEWNETQWAVDSGTWAMKPKESFADLFVACFAPTTYLRFGRVAHWSSDYATLRSIILSDPPPPPPPVSLFPNDSIYRLFRAYFLREPDQGGYAYWKSMLKPPGTLTLAQISGEFVKSPEFTSRYGTLNNWDFVKMVYRNVLGREADQAGLNHWVGLLNSPTLMPRGDLMVHFSESAEFITKINNERM